MVFSKSWVRLLKFNFKVFIAISVISVFTFCSHIPTDDRYRSSRAVILLAGCENKDQSLVRIEKKLFDLGFVRKVSPSSVDQPYLLYHSLVTRRPLLLEYIRSDFEKSSVSKSMPYIEIKNRYKVASCEQAETQQVYLFIIRHNLSSEESFLGNKFKEALSASGCSWKITNGPSDLGFFKDSTERDLLRYIDQMRCTEWMINK